MGKQNVVVKKEIEIVENLRLLCKFVVINRLSEHRTQYSLQDC